MLYPRFRSSFAAALAAAAMAAVFLSIGIQPAKAAVINWGAPQNITGSSDVDTTGSLFASAAFGSGTSIVVNSVTFDPFTASGTTSTVGNITLASTTGQALENFSVFGGPASYNGLLNSASQVAEGTAGSPRGTTITLNNLVVGGTYSIQFWANDSRSPILSLPNSRTVGVGTQTLALNVTQSEGGFGQFTTGTFTADSSTQSFGVVGNPFAGLIGPPQGNAMQVRMLAVPEPATWAVATVGVALAATCGELRRRRRMHTRES